MAISGTLVTAASFRHVWNYELLDIPQIYLVHVDYPLLDIEPRLRDGHTWAER